LIIYRRETGLERDKNNVDGSTQIPPKNYDHKIENTMLMRKGLMWGELYPPLSRKEKKREGKTKEREEEKREKGAKESSNDRREMKRTKETMGGNKRDQTRV